MTTAQFHPTFVHEQSYWNQGYRHIAGVDEAGRGALAGPVVAAAVIVAEDDQRHRIWSEVNDSKLLSPVRRVDLAEIIRSAALAWAVGSVQAVEIDRIGIAAATRQAMQQAIAGLQVPADCLLIDWVKLPQVSLPQISLAKADQQIVSVAAASILAKVHRDALMVAIDAEYPQYGFAAHKGYGARFHLAALDSRGPCPEHRHSFSPLARTPSLFDAP